MRKPDSVSKLADFGRVRLSKSFFMRDMLYSEVAMIHGLNNAPDDPDLAIKAGKRLCEELLEVVRGADAALQLPQSASTTEQLINRRRLYQEKRAVLGC